MGKQTINVGSTVNDGTGSSIRVGGQITNSNFSEIYSGLGDGSTLSFDLNTQTPTNGQALVFNAFQNKFRQVLHLLFLLLLLQVMVVQIKLLQQVQTH